MTYQEQEEYNKLSNNGKRAYDRIKTEHPNWAHSQIITKVKINEEIDIAIDNRGDITKTDVLQEVLKKAREWLVEFCEVGSSIISAIDDTISELGKAIAKGVRWIGDKLSGILNWIFD